MARPSPSCAHDDDRLRLPAASLSRSNSAEKKESTDPRLSQLCPPYVTPSSSSSLEYHRSDARIVENGFAAGSGMSNSAKVGIGLAHFRIQRDRGGNAKPLEHFLEPPEPHAHAVFVPAPVRQIGKLRHPLRRREHHPRHRTRQIPFFERDQWPHDQADSLRKPQRRPAIDWRIVQTFAGMHSCLLGPAALLDDHHARTCRGQPRPWAAVHLSTCESPILSPPPAVPSARA